MSQQDWLDKDFYKILGVTKDVSDKDLTKSYRKLARQYHPDANKGDPAAEEKFKEVSEAYDILSDPKRREEYDQLRKYGGSSAPGFGGRDFATGATGGNGNGFRFNGDIQDILGDMFSSGWKRSGNSGSSAAASRGEDLEASLKLEFSEAANGITTTVRLTSDVACDTCGGSGAKPGSSPTVCSQCSGRGVLDENQGFFSMSQPCPGCAGRGRLITDPCPTCRGSGIDRKPRQVNVRIPAGVKDGQRIKLKGRGSPGRGGGAPGDLFVVVNVSKHKLFGRSGNNLTIEIPVTYTEAVLGAKVTVPTLDGGSVTLRIPQATPTGKTFRVKGQGVTAQNGKGGDLLVTIVVDVPQTLTDEQREAVESLATVFTGNPRAILEEQK